MCNLIDLMMFLAAFGSYEDDPLVDIRLTLHFLH